MIKPPPSYQESLQKKYEQSQQQQQQQLPSPSLQSPNTIPIQITNQNYLNQQQQQQQQQRLNKFNNPLYEKLHATATNQLQVIPNAKSIHVSYVNPNTTDNNNLIKNTQSPTKFELVVQPQQQQQQNKLNSIQQQMHP
jgi:hypothetical protein